MSNDDQSRAKILLVEDNDGDAFLTCRAFAQSDSFYDVIVARDGDEAMDVLNQSTCEATGKLPDLILLDMNLPKCSGLEVLRKIKSDDDLKHIPVIILSSSRAERDVRSSYASHGNGYILKPHGLKRLAEVVAAIELFWFKTAVLAPETEERP